VLDKLGDDTDAIGVVHCFVEEIPKKLDHVWVVLGLEELYCFFLN
jgi:hypothetical protein